VKRVLLRKTARAIIIATVLILIVMMQPGCTKKMQILYFTDTDWEFAGEAMDKMHLAYTQFYSIIDFAEAFAAKAWDLVIFENRHLLIYKDAYEATLGLLLDFVQKGARVIISTSYLDEVDYDIVWGLFGYEHDYSGLVPLSVYKIDPTDEIWNDPNVIPDLNYASATDLYGAAINAFKGKAVGSGVKIATFNSGNPNDANSGAVFSANGGRTLLNAFYLDDAAIGDVPIDSDADGIADAVEWYMNEITYLQNQGGITVQPGFPVP
jgi:hypothetical protein